MGYPSGKHIQAHVIGKTISGLSEETMGGGTKCVRLTFTNGESLRLYFCPSKSAESYITTPFAANGEVKQT